MARHKSRWGYLNQYSLNNLMDKFNSLEYTEKNEEEIIRIFYKIEEYKHDDLYTLYFLNEDGIPNHLLEKLEKEMEKLWKEKEKTKKF